MIVVNITTLGDGMTISAAEANRAFSGLLRKVRSGRTIVITSHGRPVARMVPVNDGEKVAGAARTALLKRLRAAPAKAVRRWTRDELYDA
jgi:prevent-host-death family protein